jgi:hypothetical protein
MSRAMEIALDTPQVFTPPCLINETQGQINFHGREEEAMEEEKN